MEVTIRRWEAPTPPPEGALVEIYRKEGLHPYSWSNGPGDVYPAHSHPFHKVIYVVRGSITWILPESNQQMETRAGDRLELPRGVLHAARVGPEGVTCLEAHREG